MRLVYLLSVILVMTGASACSRGPSASDAVTDRVRALSESRYDDVWETLHPSQQAIVTREKFVECGLAGEQRTSPAIDEIKVLDERGEEQEIPEVGTVDVRVVTVQTRSGENTRRIDFSVLKVDGTWRWFLNQRSIDAFRTEACPA